MKSSLTRIANMAFLTLFILAAIAVVRFEVMEAYKSVALFLNIFVIGLSLVAMKKYRPSSVVHILFTVAYMIVTLCISEGGLGSILTFGVAMLVMEVASYLTFDEIQRRVIALVSALGILYVFIYSWRYRENYNYYAYQDINPNTLGLYLLYFYEIWFCLISTNKQKNILLTIALLVMSALGMLNLLSRGTLGALIAFCVLVSLPRRFFKSYTIFALVIIAIAICIAVPFIYLALYENGFRISLFGKPLFNGREIIWGRMLNAFSEKPWAWWFGLGSKVQLWEYDLNVHNNCFSIIVNFGWLGLLLYEGFVLSNIKKACIRADAVPECRCWLFMFICSTIILGFFETTTHWAASFVFAYMGLGMAQGTNIDKE